MHCKLKIVGYYIHTVLSVITYSKYQSFYNTRSTETYNSEIVVDKDHIRHWWNTFQKI